MDKLLTPDQQTELLTLARQAIQHFLETEKTIKREIDDPLFQEKRGAFVTLKVQGQLRGCIGYPLPYKSLTETVIDAAISAASRDYRFTPLKQNEMEDTRIEISVLTLPRPVQDIKEIQVGRHGIIISKGSNQGLLLPQVPVEWGWDLETYLRHGCLKAGLAEDEWKKGAKIEIFSAQVFSE